MPDTSIQQLRRLPVGAEVTAEGVSFRVWAPKCKHVSVVLLKDDAAEFALDDEGNGYFSAVIAEAEAGQRYKFRLDKAQALYPDPASRFQPEGPHGPSEIIDARHFQWTDHNWPGVTTHNRVLYELHIGTFTREGTWSAAEQQLPHLANLGVNVLEVMPVAEFPGKFGWGYDGVNLFAPTRVYGRPDDFRRFVDRAHNLGLGVILDVVYNHLGPDGNYLGQFSDHYFSRQYRGEWGDPFNLDGPGCEGVREFLLANVEYWIDEFHLDGFRFDATQGVFDASQPHILAEMSVAARRAAGRKRVFLTSENEPQDVMQLRPVEQGGCGVDAMWNDDWHHSAIVALTGRNEAYYSDYLGSAQEFVSAAKHGFLFQGQLYTWQKKRRGTRSIGLPHDAFVHYLQNHDQVANSARGERLHQLTSPGRLRAMTALLLLGPATPLLFMGQEFAASSPFIFFADHEPKLARLVMRGRHQFLQQFPSIATPEVAEQLDDPADVSVFDRSKLNWNELQENRHVFALHRDLLALRHTDPVLNKPHEIQLDGAVLNASAFVLRFFGPDEAGALDRLLLVNLGREFDFQPAPEPLLAPPLPHKWQVSWSSEDVQYGGSGHPPPEDGQGGWHMPAECAVLLTVSA